MRSFHKGWLAVLVAVQLAFLFAMPIFAGNDERTHNDRLWALADGHFFCKTLPRAVRDLDPLSRSFPVKPADYWKTGLSLSGGGERIDGNSYGCYYFPVALALPALGTRAVALDWNGAPRRGGAFLALYVSRLISLALVDVALLFFLEAVPWARFTALAFFSNPMMIEQSVSVGHDSLLFCLCLVILALAFSRVDWRAVGLIAISATVMALIKPIFMFFGLLALPMIAQLTPKGWRALDRKHRSLALAWLLPLPVYGPWSLLGNVGHRMWHPRFVDSGAQVSYLLHNPLRVLSVMVGYLHYLIDDGKLPDFIPHRINGEWTTLFFADLWITPPKLGCLAETTRDRRARQIAALAVAATILALYITYTPVGNPGPFAVQGRYHACALLALTLLGLHALKRARPLAWRAAIAAGLTGAALLLIANRYALVTIWRYYWA